LSERTKIISASNRNGIRLEKHDDPRAFRPESMKNVTFKWRQFLNGGLNGENICGDHDRQQGSIKNAITPRVIDYPVPRMPIQIIVRSEIVIVLLP
jgi:hypothetical protein